MFRTTRQWFVRFEIAISSVAVLAGCGCLPQSSDDGTSDTETCDTDECGCVEVGCACPSGQCGVGMCSNGVCVLEEDGMMLVPQGWFWMGCREGLDMDELSGPCPQDELPYREVFLDSFWIDRLEVTRGDYARCMDEGQCEETDFFNSGHYEGPLGEGEFVPGPNDYPVAGARWNQAVAYCTWAGKRLPTEAEWEKAARGTEGAKYPWGDGEPTCDLGNFALWDVEGMKHIPCPQDLAEPVYMAVGSFPDGASPYGVLDMAGNAYEWVADGHDGEGYEGLPDHNPTGSQSLPFRTSRGGSYQTPEFSATGYALRTSARAGGSIDGPAARFRGFRCARSAEPNDE